MGVGSQERAGQKIDLYVPIQQSLNFVFKSSLLILALCGVASSCRSKIENGIVLQIQEQFFIKFGKK